MYIEQSEQIIMQPKNTLSITEARKIIFSIANDVQKPDTHYTLTENGRPKAVIMSAEEFESWQETVEILANKNIMDDISASKKEFAKNDYITLDQFLEEEGYIKTVKNVRNNPKQKIGKKS